MRNWAGLTSLLLVAVFAGPATSATAPPKEEGSTSCRATVIRGDQPQSLRFRLPICGPGPHRDLLIRSSQKITATRTTVTISRPTGQRQLDCGLARERRPTGPQPVIFCPGYFGGYGGKRTVLGSFRIEGRRCDAATRFSTEPYDCEPGIGCPATGAPILRQRVPAPQGCA